MRQLRFVEAASMPPARGPARFAAPLVCAALALLGATGRPEEPTPETPPAAAGAASPDTAPKVPLDFKLGLAASYTQNLSGVSEGGNALRVFDGEAGRPVLNQAVLHLAWEPSPLGFEIDLVSGADVPVFAPRGAWFPEAAAFEQAFARWRPARRFELQGGRFVTSAGYELIDPWGNASLSRSFLFGYAIPFTHTGVRASYEAGDALTLLAGVNRGWDKWTDDNGAASLEAAVTFKVSPSVSLALSTHHGREGPDEAETMRHLFDLVLRAKLGEAWTLGLNADYAEDAAPGTTGRWYGLAAYAERAGARWSTALRLEDFHDPDGARTGVPQALREATVTLGWRARPQVWLRIEARHDLSTEAVFGAPGGDAKQRGQTTLAVAVIAQVLP